MKTMLSLDPGGTTGAAFFEYSDNEYELLWKRQIPNGLQGFLDWHWDEAQFFDIDTIVCESFDLRAGIYPDLSPVYIIGAVEALWPNAVVDIEYQKPSQKHLCEDVILKKMNLHSPGKPHANDAVRHGIIYMRNRKNNQVLKEGWGD